MRKFFTKKKIIISAILIIILIVAISVGNGNNKKEIIAVTRGEVVQEIVVTGKALAKNEVELGFDKTGRIARSFAVVGDKVRAGQILAELDISSELADLSKEKAVLAEEEAKIGGDKESLASAIRESFAAADNAVRNKTDQFFKTPRDNPSFEVKFTDGNFVHYFSVPSSVVIDFNNERKSIETTLNEWQKELLTLTAANAENFSEKAVQRLNLISDFLDKVAHTINTFTPVEFAYEATVTGYKTAIDLARSGVDAARSSLITTKGNVSAVASGSSQGEARKAQIHSAIAAIEASIAKSKIVAPFAGTITQQDAKVGAIVSAGSALISIISDSQMYIEANVSEINIGKIAVDNSAAIEFDAFPGESFFGKVTYIEPGETIVDGVVNYKTRVNIDPFDPRIKSGLTANLTIQTARIDNALVIPSFAIFKEGDKSFVSKLKGEKFVKTEVQVGLSGSNGKVEIIQGLTEGERVEFVLQ